jgi:hypothetical protein
MSQSYGIQRPLPHRQADHRPRARYLVLIESAGSGVALLFTESRELAADFDAGAEEVALMTRGLQPAHGAAGPEWDRALAGHGLPERAAARVYTLDV